MNAAIRLPKRKQIKTADTWDLSSLFATDAAWEKSFQRFEKRLVGYEKFPGTLGSGPEALAACLKFDSEISRLSERLGVYAFLRTTEDQKCAEYQRMYGRFHHVATRANEASSFLRPEILGLSTARLNKFLDDPALKPYRLVLERLRRYKKHTLGKGEETLLAMQGEMSEAAGQTFRQLHDADMKFGLVKDEKGRDVELGTATFAQFLTSSKRSVRKSAFHRYYEQFAAHENTLAATLSGSIQKDVYYARARGYQSCLQAAMFPDNVPQSVYDRLISAVREHLPTVHHYYDVRRRKMKLRSIHHYDTYVPILVEKKTRHSWSKATKVVLNSLAPLGKEYVNVLEKGLQGRWCDRYPNEGKQSGAFSCGSFDGDPYILMNYKPDVLEDVFTLTHEAGHSMHSFLSAKHQPFLHYDYTIFVAEVASTFNEQLLSRHLMNNAKDDQQRAFLINREIDAIRGTIIRQTMFAEFEKITHEMAEQGEPLTVQAFKDVYGTLLETYFGPEFSIDALLKLECFRIPHFYRPFYVYKYATGLSAAIALSQRVLSGGRRELRDYLGFLKGGCSQDPLDLLRSAGVDMESPQPVETALARFGELVDELDTLI